MISYAALLLELADRRSQAPSRLSAAAAKLDMTVWPAPLVKLFLGQNSAAAALAAAKDPDPVKTRARMCEANFYTAEYALLTGSQAGALPGYRAAARDCPEYLQRGAASAALRSLGVTP